MIVPLHIMIKGVLFDKDDTLIDMGQFWAEPCRATVCEILHNSKLPLTGDAISKMMLAVGFFDGCRVVPGGAIQCLTNEDVVGCMMDAARGLGASFSQGDAEAILEIFHKNIYKYGKATATCDLQFLFSELHERGIFIGIATSDEYLITKHCMSQLGIDGMVDIFITADRVGRHKPSPESAFIFFEKFGLSPDEVIMVGDSEVDMEFAENAGILGVKYAHDGDMRHSIADIIVKSPLEVLDIIDKI